MKTVYKENIKRLAVQCQMRATGHLSDRHPDPRPTLDLAGETLEAIAAGAVIVDGAEPEQVEEVE